MKKITGIPPPKRFWFGCQKCGTYRVSETTARRFLTELLRNKLYEALQKGAERAVLTFKDGCPNCKPDNPDAAVELSVLRRRRH